jgi:hypothetical protein
MKKKQSDTYAQEVLRDKQGTYSMRELVTFVFVIMTIISWIAQQFFGKQVPEYMFYSFVSIIAAGCFGYSFERKTKIFNQENNENNKEP